MRTRAVAALATLYHTTPERVRRLLKSGMLPMPPVETIIELEGVIAQMRCIEPELKRMPRVTSKLCRRKGCKASREFILIPET